MSSGAIGLAGGAGVPAVPNGGSSRVATIPALVFDVPSRSVHLLVCSIRTRVTHAFACQLPSLAPYRRHRR
jgi:hypothetical protein